MTQALPRYPTVEDYLNSDQQLDGRYEYADGELIPVVSDMPAPLLVAEVVSPYPRESHKNYQEDYVRRPYQYAMRGIPEYWIIDPQRKIVIVRSNPAAGGYAMSQKFQGDDWVRSQLPELEKLQLAAQQILSPDL